MDSRKLLTWHNTPLNVSNPSAFGFSLRLHTLNIWPNLAAQWKSIFRNTDIGNFWGLSDLEADYETRLLASANFDVPWCHDPWQKQQCLNPNRRAQNITPDQAVSRSSCHLGAALWQSRQSTPQSLDCDPLVVARWASWYLTFAPLSQMLWNCLTH